MSIFEIILIGIGLSMDAFAVSICKGLRMRKINWGHALIVGGFFGGFQALMPFIGWLLGSGFINIIDKYDHWVAFILLAFIGIKMIVEAVREMKSEKSDDDEKGDGENFNIPELLLLAVATSIDALAVGITMAFLEVNIIKASLTIGLTTFIICLAGVLVGYKFGSKYKCRAEIAGGAILTLMGLRILLEGLGVLPF